MELRQSPRLSSNLSVTILHPSFNRITAKVKNISAGGLAVDMSTHTKPPVGTVVHVLIKRFTGAVNEQPIAAKVTHTQANGIVGLMFI